MFANVGVRDDGATRAKLHARAFAPEPVNQPGAILMS